MVLAKDRLCNRCEKSIMTSGSDWKFWDMLHGRWFPICNQCNIYRSEETKGIVLMCRICNKPIGTSVMTDEHAKCFQVAQRSTVSLLRY